MKPSYHISYRNEIVETQGKLFGRLFRENPGCDAADFINAYMRSETRAGIDRAEALVANMTASELKSRFVEKEGYVFKKGPEISPFPADWIGQFYAYYQWAEGVTSRELIEQLPLRLMVVAYPGLHDLDMSLAVERISKELKEEK